MLGFFACAWAGLPASAMTAAATRIVTRARIGVSPLGWCRPRLLERVDLLPVGFHVDDRPAPRLRLVERLVESADVRLAVVGPFAGRVGVMDDAHEPRALAGRRPLEHLLVAVRVAEREHGPPADELLDVHRLAGAVVDEVDLRLAKQRGLTVRSHLVRGHEA